MSIAGACALAVLPGVALAAPTKPYTLVTIDIGETSSPAVTSRVFSADGFTVSVNPQTDGSTWMYFRDGPQDSRLSLLVKAPTGEHFVNGRTYSTTRFGDADNAKGWTSRPTTAAGIRPVASPCGRPLSTRKPRS